MKRVTAPLVEYASDEETGQDELVPPQKKRKLPALPSSLTVAVPVDNPALHQGRIRTQPHVDGQYATHVYVSLRMKSRDAMYQLLREVISEAKNSVPSLQEISSFDAEGNTTSKSAELHISLSRPIYLRAHQREDFKRDVMQIAKRHKSFPLTFTTFSELVNDERTRTFLTVEVGAGYGELQSLALALTPAIRVFRQKGYYENPRFHASIAWALLDRDTPQATGGPAITGRGSGGNTSSHVTTPRTSSDNNFPTIPHLPIDLVPALNERYGTRLVSSKISLFEVERVTVKIGRDTFSWSMTG